MTVFENFFCPETGRILTWIFASRSQQTPGSSWEKPGGVNLKKASFQRCLGRKMLLHDGFQFLEVTLGKVEKLQTVASCDCLDPTCPTRIFSEGYICWLSPASTE